MRTCPSCSKVVRDGDAAYCPYCGARLPVDDAQFVDAQPIGSDASDARDRFSDAVHDIPKAAGAWYDKAREASENTPDDTVAFDPEDIRANGAMAVIAYLGLLCLVPVIGARSSRFATFHANQGFVLFVCEALTAVVLSWGGHLLALIAWPLAVLAWVLQLVWVAWIALMVVGITNAASGRARELPVIGGVHIID